jgi:uncharacterized protein YkwD
MRAGTADRRRARALARLAMVAAVAGVALLPGQGGAFDRGNAERELVTLTNSDRTSNGLTSLRPNDPLADVARGRSQDMADRNYFSHEIPPANNFFEDLLPPAGIQFRLAGENIARNNAPDNETARRAQTGFLNSPMHRANIMEPNYREVGIGAWDRPDRMKYYTVLFITPMGGGASAPPSGLLAAAPPAAEESALGPALAEALLGPAQTAHAQRAGAVDEVPPASDGSGRQVRSGAAPPPPGPTTTQRATAEVVASQPAQIGVLDGIITRVLKLYLSV